MLTLQSLTGIDVLTSPANTLRFIDKVETINTAGVKILDLQYLLTHQATDLGDRILPEATITVWLQKLQGEYQKAFDITKSLYKVFDSTQSADAIAQTAEDNKISLKDLLGQLPNDPDNLQKQVFDEVTISKFMTILDATWLSTSATDAFIDATLGKFFGLVQLTLVKTKQGELAIVTTAEQSTATILAATPLSDPTYQSKPAVSNSKNSK